MMGDDKRTAAAKQTRTRCCVNTLSVAGPGYRQQVETDAQYTATMHGTHLPKFKVVKLGNCTFANKLAH